MANDHVIDVVVRADTTALTSGLAAAQGSLGQASSRFAGLSSAIERNSSNMKSVGKEAAIMGGAILAGVGLAVHAYAEFSGRMAQVQSLSHASSGEMDTLTKSALSMGTAFGLSANDVADAEIELVKAGVSVKEMMGGALPGALALAAAGQIDVGKATEIATIALTQFNLKGKDVPHVADLLAAGADKALGGVEELGMGLKQGGLIASQFGLSIDDTIGTLSAFANAGLLGSDAGTSMKTMFLALASPSKQAQKALDEYNITAYDSGGRFKGVADLAGQLHDKLGPLADAQRNAALSTIFGTDAMRSASVLMKEGSAGIQKWIKDVNDQGFAAVQAAGKMDSLNGDVKKLQASFQTGLIKMGATADGSLRPVVQRITDVMTAFSNMDPAVQGSVMGIAAVAGGALLLGGGLLTVIPKINDTVTAVRALATSSPRAASAIGTIGKAAGIAAAAVVALSVASALATETHAKSTADYGQALLKVGQSTGAIDSSKLDSVFQGFDKFANMDVSTVDSMASAVNRLTHIDPTDNFQKFAGGLTTMLGAPKAEIGQLEDRMKGLGETMGNLVSSGGAETAAKTFQVLTSEFKKNGQGAKEALEYLPGYKHALQALGTQYGVVIEGQDLVNLALGKTPQKLLDAQNSTEGQAKAAAVAAQATADQQKALEALGLAADGTIPHLDKLVQSMISSGLISLSARDAARNFEKSIDDLSASIAKNGTTMDITTQKGRDNQAAFDGIAGAGLKSAEAMAKNGESQTAVQANLKGTYDALVNAAAKFGITGDEADTMARQVMGIPKDVPIETSIQNFADTMAKAQAIKGSIDQVQSKKIQIEIETYRTEKGTAALDAAQNGGPGKASGGAIDDAPGPKGVDSKSYMLAKGEHVLSDADVDAMGGQAGVYAFRKQLHDGGQRPMYGAPAPPPPAIAMTGGGEGGPTQMTGTLVMDSGEILGVFHGIATQAVTSGLNNVATMAGGRR